MLRVGQTLRNHLLLKDFTTKILVECWVSISDRFPSWRFCFWFSWLIFNINSSLDFSAGYNYYGTERMYSGTDGREFEVDIFFGLVYYQRLRHMVADKYQVRKAFSIPSSIALDFHFVTVERFRASE